MKKFISILCVPYFLHAHVININVKAYIPPRLELKKSEILSFNNTSRSKINNNCLDIIKKNNKVVISCRM